MTKSIPKINYASCILVFLSITLLIGFSACKKSDTPDRPKRTKKLLAKMTQINPFTKDSMHSYTYKYNTLGRMIAYYDFWLFYRKDSIVGEDTRKPGLERGTFNYTNDGKLASVNVYFKEELMFTHTFKYNDSFIEQIETVRGSSSQVVTGRYYVSNGNLNRLVQNQKYFREQSYDSTEFLGNMATDTAFTHKTFMPQYTIIENVSITFDNNPGAFSGVSVKMPLWWFWARYSPAFYVGERYLCNIDHNPTNMTVSSKSYSLPTVYYFEYQYDYDGFPTKQTKHMMDDPLTDDILFEYYD